MNGWTNRENPVRVWRALHLLGSNKGIKDPRAEPGTNSTKLDRRRWNLVTANPGRKRFAEC